jgi:hypothetical protein
MSRSTIRGISITFAALVVSAINIFWMPNNPEDDVQQLIALLLSVVGLGVLISLTEWLLLRLWIRKFAGEWFYTSDAKSLDPNGHVGHVNFFIRGGEIKYTVNIYRFADALRLAQGDKSAGAQSPGSAKSEAVFFDGEGQLKVLYDYTPFQGEGGLGVLDISGVQNGKAMSGAWVSARRNLDGPMDGIQKWFRRDDFVKFIDREFPNGLPAPKAKK